jgi:Raf kinase inhibitor-like YbhB/YbcL family protein
MKLSSPAFDPEGWIPTTHTCDGEDISPPLNWEGVPERARSLALIMQDPDAPSGTWIHWVVYDLPPDTGGLYPGVDKSEAMTGGAAQGACWGVDSFSRVGYFGPCPPPGPAHRYCFHLYALDVKLGLPPRATQAEVLAAMRGHVVAEAELVGRYGR